MTEYLCELHGRRFLVEPPDCKLCKPRPRSTFLRGALAKSAKAVKSAVEETGSMDKKPLTKIMVPVDTPQGMGVVEIDVRSLGFLSVDELKKEPDWERYIDEAVRIELEKGSKR